MPTLELMAAVKKYRGRSAMLAIIIDCAMEVFSTRLSQTILTQCYRIVRDSTPEIVLLMFHACRRLHSKTVHEPGNFIGSRR